MLRTPHGGAKRGDRVDDGGCGGCLVVLLLVAVIATVFAGLFSAPLWAGVIVAFLVLGL
jgi:hypothetical protein